MLCKPEVAFISARHSHDCTGTITGQHIFTYINGDFSPVKRIHRICTCEYAGDRFLSHALALTAAFNPCEVLVNFLFMFMRSDRFNQFMLGSDHHKINPKNGVRSCRKNTQLVITVNDREIDLGTIAFTDPVGLHFLHCFAEIHCFQAFQQTVCIFCDTQVPLSQFLFYNRITASLTYTIHHFIIRQHSS